MNITLSSLGIRFIGIAIIALPICALIFGIIGFVRLFSNLRKLNHPENMKYYYMLIICIFVMLISWIFNFGWLRVFLTWLSFPVIHAVIFGIINGKSLLKLHLSAKLKIYTLLSFVSYIISYFAFPDGGDGGTMYVFFGLLHGDAATSVAFTICYWSFITHLVITVLQIIELIIVKLKMVKKTKSMIPNEDIQSE